MDYILDATIIPAFSPLTNDTLAIINQGLTDDRIEAWKPGLHSLYIEAATGASLSTHLRRSNEPAHTDQYLRDLISSKQYANHTHS